MDIQKRINRIENAIEYQIKLLETIIDQLDTRRSNSDQMRGQIKQQAEAMAERLKAMPGVSGNPQYQQAITDIFKSIGMKS